MNSFALGRYLPMDSFIHKLDPRIKMISMFILLIAVFLPAGFVGYGIMGVALLGLVFLSKLKLSFIYRAMKPMFFMLVFLLVINIFVIKTGPVLFDINGFMIHTDAIVQTCYITFRLILMIMVTTVLTATTKPLDLTLAIEDLLSVFKRFHVPAHEIAMMISIALRFIPTLIEETDRIMKAQASRGVDLKEGTLKEKIMAILSLIVPLFVSSFQRAEDLANAMEARGYSPTKTRTRYKQLKVQTKDILSFIVVIFVFISIAVVAVYI